MSKHEVQELDREFPNNSHRIKTLNNKPVSEEREVVKKIIQGSVVKKKKGFFTKLKEAFIGEDSGSVRNYVIYDVIIPATKKTISDVVSGGIEMVLFGERRSSNVRRDRDRSYVNYSSVSTPDRYSRTEPSLRNRSRHNFDDIVLETRGDAEDVLTHLSDLVSTYDQATVADLYDLVGITTNYTDNKFGWTNLSTAAVVRVRDGYQLDLPKARALD